MLIIFLLVNFAERKKRQNLITLSSSQAEEIAKLTLPQTASVSERVLIASAAEKDRISELKVILFYF